MNRLEELSTQTEENINKPSTPQLENIETWLVRSLGDEESASLSVKVIKDNYIFLRLPRTFIKFFLGFAKFSERRNKNKNPVYPGNRWIFVLFRTINKEFKGP